MQLLIFILISFMFLLAEMAIMRWIIELIKEDAPVDIFWKWLTGRSWQDMLRDLYESNKKWKNNLGKALGDCQMCLSFWFAPVWFFIYFAFCKIVLGYWITGDIESWWGVIFVNCVWYWIFHALGSMAGWISLMKYKKKKS